MPTLRPRGTAVGLFVVALTVGCQQTREHSPSLRAAVAPPAVGAPSASTLPGLHNVVTYAPDVICGGVPEGAEGLQTLAAMGVQSIVSVDGATPDVAGAERRGMRYVHLPISYDTVTAERQQQLAQALHSLPRPIYVHCHHGKHRSAAALATAAVRAGVLTNDEALERMAVSGTAKDYQGLWQAVREASPLPQDGLRADPASFPSVSKVSGLVATMAAIDLVFDLVKQAQKAGWQAPQDHPDLVAPKETARLAQLFDDLQHDADSQALAADYQAMLQRAIAGATALDAALRASDRATADRWLEALGKGCKECHKDYRDRR
ncbi:MAG: cytochrome c [Planctomycetes bacterium]|nr:cytochrome c [Planctomycetota bacterium]